MGGRSNAWRRLNLLGTLTYNKIFILFISYFSYSIDLQRHTIFYDVINYATNKQISKRLQKELPVLLQIPHTQEIQLAQIEALNNLE